jgi:hypothetical protein
MILGIDNGLFGCLAFYNVEELILYDMPILQVNDRNVLDMQAIVRLIKGDIPQHVFLEKTTPMPKLGGLPCYSMGHSEGFMLGVFTSLNIPYTLVRPKDWKKTMGCPADKDGARQRASQLMPQYAHNWPLKKHHDRAEASLIALYGFQKRTRDISTPG